MADQQHIDRLKQGAEAWNGWRQGHMDVPLDLNNVDLSNVPDLHLEGVILKGAQLKGAYFGRVHLEGATLTRAQLNNAHLSPTHLKNANLVEAQLENAFLEGADLENANLTGANLRGAELTRATLKRAKLIGAHLEGATLTGTQLRGAYLQGAFFDNETKLEGVDLGNKHNEFAWLADIRWENANLAQVDWSSVISREEHEACQRKTSDQKMKNKSMQIKDYQVAIRVNRQVAVALQDQGLKEAAASFAFRMRVLERKMLWKQGNFGRWLLSMFFAILGGYGYRLWRLFLVYFILLIIFALAYFFLGNQYDIHGHLQSHLSPEQALYASITAFHGRVFSVEPFEWASLSAWITAIEAVVGVILEGTFIAILVKRLFGE